MQIPGSDIAVALENLLKKQVDELKKQGVVLKLIDFLVGESPDQISFVAQKKKKADKLGIKFELIQIKQTPYFQKFANQIKERSEDPTVTGIIIQHPLPPQLSTNTIYDFIHINKEIEGHKKKTPFSPPLGLAALTALKYAFTGQKISEDLFVDIARDRNLFKSLIKNKKVVLLGRGSTGGQPIGNALTNAGIGYINLNSQTPNPQEYCKEADIIITAVGQHVIKPEILKPGVILLNAGVRRDNGKLRGDYIERDIDKVASFYTPTPGGLGPIDVTYLYWNLLEAAKLQIKNPPKRK